jgi:hypothetical protein
VLLDVQAHRALHVGPEVAVQPGIAGDEADLDGLRMDRGSGERQDDKKHWPEKSFHVPS